MTDKYISASKLLALQQYDYQNEWKNGAPKGFYTVFKGEFIKVSDLRALIDEAPEVEPIAYAEQDNIDMHNYDDLSFSYPVSTQPTENRTAPLYAQPKPNIVAELVKALEDDAHAAIFQSMAQYRKALLKLIKPLDN